MGLLRKSSGLIAFKPIQAKNLSHKYLLFTFNLYWNISKEIFNISPDVLKIGCGEKVIKLQFIEYYVMYQLVDIYI